METMTKSKLLEIGDIWYDRAKRLFEYTQDDTIHVDKRIQAARLFYEMQQRVSLIFQFTIRMSQPKAPLGIRDFKIGGITYKN